jgi:hypothetical protein
MVAFNIGGDWTWTGAVDYTGASLSASITGDIQMEAGGTARFDSAFGATGDVEIANSNATHLQLGNTSCAVDLACTTFTFNGSGAINLHSTTSLDLDAPTIGIGVSTCTALNIGHAATTWVAAANVFGLTSANGMTLSAGTGLTLNGTNFNHLGVGTGGSTSVTIGSAVAGSITAINSDNLQIFSSGVVDFQAVGATTFLNSSGSSLDLGNNALVATVSANTWTMNTVGTLHIGSGGAMTLGSGASIDISAPSVTCNTSAATNVFHIGNPLAGNVLSIETVDIQMPNGMTVTATNGYVMQNGGQYLINCTSAIDGGVVFNNSTLNLTNNSATHPIDMVAVSDIRLISTTASLLLQALSGNVTVNTPALQLEGLPTYGGPGAGIFTLVIDTNTPGGGIGTVKIGALAL